MDDWSVPIDGLKWRKFFFLVYGCYFGSGLSLDVFEQVDLMKNEV